jgi:hypothetical protein
LLSHLLNFDTSIYLGIGFWATGEASLSPFGAIEAAAGHLVRGRSRAVLVFIIRKLPIDPRQTLFFPSLALLSLKIILYERNGFENKAREG